MAEVVMACAASGWQAEQHVFFGTPETIVEKVRTLPVGTGRRLFYASVERGTGGKVYEYEHKEGSNYGVKVAETNAPDAFNQAVERAMYANKGESCVGNAVQSLPEFRALRFAPLTEVVLTSDHEFGELFPLDQTSRHVIPGGNPSARFARVTFSVLC